MYSALLDCYRPGYHIVPGRFLRCDHKIHNIDYEFTITYILDEYSFKHVMQTISVQNYFFNKY